MSQEKFKSTLSLKTTTLHTFYRVKETLRRWRLVRCEKIVAQLCTALILYGMHYIFVVIFFTIYCTEDNVAIFFII